MDLRPRNLTPKQIERARSWLAYQPFIVTDDFQTGAGYSFAHKADPRETPALRFDRGLWDDEQWRDITASNRALAAMYDDFVAAVATRYPGGSLLDVACNNGYMPVKAETLGMRRCIGLDQTDYGPSVKLLNEVLGTEVKFVFGSYDPLRHRGPERHRADVVMAMAIMCHLPDPLHFLKYLGGLAREAVLFWGQVVQTDSYLIAYNPPYKGLNRFEGFPHGFNDNTRISRGLLRDSLAGMGFRNQVEIAWRPEWLPQGLFVPRHPNLEGELAGGSPHIALLAMR